jgi:hypothetical protein
MIANGIKQTTTTTGTGDLTLVAVSNTPTFSDHFPIGQAFFYAIRRSDGTIIEEGIGKLSAFNTMVRSQALQTYNGSFANDNPSLVSLPAATYDVICSSNQHLGINSFPGIHASAAIRAILAYPYIATGNTKSLTADTPTIAAIRIDAGKGISSLGVGVQSASGTASNKIRIGLYSINVDGSPGVLVAETGNMLPNTTGNKSASLVGGRKHIPPGWYYAAILCDVTPTLAAVSVSAIAQGTPFGFNDPFNPNSGAIGSAVGSGWTSMPSSITVSAMIPISSDFMPGIYIYM